MRTTIEIKPEHRARLLELAARRGEKGFSSVIAEAVAVYLAGSTERERFRKRALRLRGTLPPDEAQRLRQNSEILRGLSDDRRRQMAQVVQEAFQIFKEHNGDQEESTEKRRKKWGTFAKHQQLTNV